MPKRDGTGPLCREYGKGRGMGICRRNNASDNVNNNLKEMTNETNKTLGKGLRRGNCRNNRSMLNSK